MLKIKLIIAMLIVSFAIIFIRLLSAQEVNMKKNLIYDEIKLAAKEEGWKMCFFGGDAKGDTVIKVHDFKTGNTSDIYSFSVNAFAEFWPSISNHGDKVGFWLEENFKENSLYVINIDGSNLEKIVTVENGHGIAWSEDGKKIAFIGSLTEETLLEKNAALYVVDIKDKSVKAIIENHMGGITNQSWSRNGERLLYGYKKDIINYNLSTNKSIKIAEGNWCGWSPKGDWIAYLQEGKINLINPDTLERRTLVEDKNISVPIYWLPNGEYLVYGVIAPDAEIGEPYVVRISDKKVEAIPDMLWMLASWSKGE